MDVSGWSCACAKCSDGSGAFKVFFFSGVKERNAIPQLTDFEIPTSFWYELKSLTETLMENVNREFSLHHGDTHQGKDWLLYLGHCFDDFLTCVSLFSLTAAEKKQFPSDSYICALERVTFDVQVIKWGTKKFDSKALMRSLCCWNSIIKYHHITVILILCTCPNLIHLEWGHGKNPAWGLGGTAEPRYSAPYLLSPVLCNWKNICRQFILERESWQKLLALLPWPQATF